MHLEKVKTVHDRTGNLLTHFSVTDGVRAGTLKVHGPVAPSLGASAQL